MLSSREDTGSTEGTTAMLSGNTTEKTKNHPSDGCDTSADTNRDSSLQDMRFAISQIHQVKNQHMCYQFMLESQNDLFMFIII